MIKTRATATAVKTHLINIISTDFNSILLTHVHDYNSCLWEMWKVIKSRCCQFKFKTLK